MWTPTLTVDGEAKPPYGLIFATFMVACMAGSQLFSLLLRRVSIDSIVRLLFVVSAAALSMPVWATRSALMWGFFAFEACVGIYFPSMNTIKSRIVPEDARAAMYNIFRVPLNAIVLTVLLTDIPITTAFCCCTAMLLAGAYCQNRLMQYSTYTMATDTEEV